MIDQQHARLLYSAAMTALTIIGAIVFFYYSRW